MADFLPDTIGDDFRFPTRTVLSEKMGLDWIGSTITPMAESNLPFVFEVLSVESADFNFIFAVDLDTN